MVFTLKKEEDDRPRAWVKPVAVLSAIACVASTLAASTKLGSFSSVRACCGVLLITRTAVQSSRDGASKFASIGCKNVRCQCEYTPRRYCRSSTSAA